MMRVNRLKEAQRVKDSASFPPGILLNATFKSRYRTIDIRYFINDIPISLWRNRVEYFLYSIKLVERKLYEKTSIGN